MIRISVIQFQPALADLEKTMDKLNRLLPGSSDSQLVVLPELANSGYNFKDKAQAIETSEDPENSRFVNFISQYAIKYNQHIVTGFNERAGDILFNAALLIGPEGLKGKYRKIHLFMDEKDFFEHGDLGLPVFQIDNYNLGMLVCFDYLFPEIWRKLASKGADIIAHPSNLVTPFGQKVVPAHAIINGIFTVTANRIGAEGTLHFNGNSLIVNPRGDVLKQGETDKEQIVTVEIDPSMARNKWITKRNHVLDDRMPGLYN